VLAPAVKRAQGQNEILLEENNSSYGFEMLNARSTHILKSELIKIKCWNLDFVQDLVNQKENAS